MEQPSFIRDFVIILAAAFSGGMVAKKLKLPMLSGYLLAGMVTGILVSRYASLEGSLKDITELGVALLLFTIGLEFSINKFKGLGEVVIYGSLIQVLLSSVAGLIFFPVLGFDFYSSLFLGVALSLSSTAAVLKILADHGDLETLQGEITAGWLFLQDLYTLPIIILLPAIGKMIKGEITGTLPFITFIRSIFIAVVSFFLIIYLGNKIIPKVFDFIAEIKSREMVIIAAVGICLLFAYVFNLLGISYAVGASIAGIVLSSSSAHHEIFSEIRPLKDLFSTIFFVSLGFLINPVFIFGNWFIILLIILFVFITKIIISSLLIYLLGYHPKTALICGLSLISVGEYAFILAILGVNTNLINHYQYMIILSVTFISLVLSMPVTANGDKIYYFLKSNLQKLLPEAATFINHMDVTRKVDDFEINNHIVILGHGRVGKYISRTLTQLRVPFVVIDYNHHLVKSLRESGTNVIYGDPAEIEVLKFSRVEKAKAVIIAYSDRFTQEIVITNILSLNPTVRIIARIHFAEDARKIKSLGVTSVVQPEIEAAYKITDILLNYLYPGSKSYINP